MLSHRTPDRKCLTNAIELCSGIGALGEGVEHNGYVIKVRNDLRAPYSAFLQRQGFDTTVVGDVGSNHVIAKIHEHCPDSALHTAGFPCQPWSRMGDQQRTLDSRGRTLHAILRTAFMLRAHTLLLECVTQAREDPEIMKLIYRWCKCTGYNAREKCLELSTLWPSRRSRWWVVLSFAGSTPADLEPMPVIQDHICVADVLPSFPEWPDEHNKQLILDAQELSLYQDYGNMAACIVDMNQALRTALHSLGNHHTGCPCGCRDWPLRVDRLQRQGIHGILVPIPHGEVEARTPAKLRLIHPWELSLLQGLKPDKEWMPHLRLSLSGLGQMASPLQSGWIISQHVWANHDHTLESIHTPEHSLWLQTEALFAARDAMFPIQRYGARTQDFRKRLQTQLAMKSQTRRIAKGLSCAENIADIISASIEVPWNDESPMKTRSEVEMLEHEEKSPVHSDRSIEASIDGEVDQDPYQMEHSQSPTPEEWALFAQVQAAEEPPGFVDQESTETHAEPRTGAVATAEELTSDTSDLPNTALLEATRIPNATQVEHDDIVEPTHVTNTHALAALPDESMHESEGHASSGIRTEPAVSEDATHQLWHRTGAIPAFQMPVRTAVEAPPTCSPTATWEVNVAMTPPVEPASECVNSHAAGSESALPTDEPAPPENTHEDSGTLVNPHASVSESALPPAEPASPAAFHATPSTEITRMEHSHEHVHCVQIFVASPASPVFIEVKVPEGTTIGQVIEAERRLLSHTQDMHATSLLGTKYVIEQRVEPSMWLKIHAEGAAGGGFPPTRLQQLFDQGPQVATDEMAYYLSDHPFGEQIHMYGVLGFGPDDPPTVVHEQLSQQLQGIVANLQDDKPHVFALVCKNHWMPFIVDQYDDWLPSTGFRRKIRVTTTEEGMVLLNLMSREREYCLPYEIDVLQHAMPQMFPHDCGYQVKIWLLNVIGARLDEEWIPHVWVQPFQADQWRLQFHTHLVASLQGFAPAGKLITGGMLGADMVTTQLEQLLTQHGVPSKEVGTRASEVLNHLGRHAVTTCMRSAKPWRDLKAKANSHLPRLQLILPGELEAKLQERALNGPPIQSKKKVPKQTKPKPVIQVLPEDLVVPQGIFQTSAGQLMQQIQIEQIGPEAQGIILVQAHQAQPYLKMQRPVSTGGLALLVLNHQHDSLAQVGTLTRFPARSTSTQEPMIVSAKLVQLGQQVVARSQPKQTLSIEESETFVLRVMCYQDELGPQWDAFTTKPVRHILTELGLIGTDKETETPVVDVWDRQWLTIKLVRTQPDASAMFVVNLRLTGVSLQQLLSKSGQGGMYMEPRDETGRQAHAGYRVVWLPNTNKSTALAAIQTSPHWAALVRYGNRMGLRTLLQHAESLHKTHKPQTPYLHSAQVRNFAVGPLPFNCTKASLAKAFTQWGWKARAVQPRGRAVDGTGVLWSVQAEEGPPAVAFQMSHGDVIVTEDDPKRSPLNTGSPEVQASAKTVAALRERSSGASVANAHADPWEKDDPWGPYNKIKRTTPPELSPQQFRALEESIRDKIAPVAKDNAETDVPMIDESRIANLEHRMQQFEHTLQTQAQHQQQQHFQVTQSIAQVQQNLDNQNQSIHQALDQRFGEQLRHMERLLSRTKRSGDEME
eukprot:Skav223706  [mRNA]  locus=scaffold2379:65847:70727:+ [translate_table: standard]